MDSEYDFERSSLTAVQAITFKDINNEQNVAGTSSHNDLCTMFEEDEEEMHTADLGRTFDKPMYQVMPDGRMVFEEGEDEDHHLADRLHQMVTIGPTHQMGLGGQNYEMTSDDTIPQVGLEGTIHYVVSEGSSHQLEGPSHQLAALVEDRNFYMVLEDPHHHGNPYMVSEDPHHHMVSEDPHDQMALVEGTTNCMVSQDPSHQIALEGTDPYRASDGPSHQMLTRGFNIQMVSEGPYPQMVSEGPIHPQLSKGDPHHQVVLYGTSHQDDPHHHMESNYCTHEEVPSEALTAVEAQIEEEEAAKMQYWFMMDCRDDGFQKMTRFCLLVSPAPISLKAAVFRRTGNLFCVTEFEKLELPRGFDCFMRTYTCWQVRIPPSCVGVVVTATFPRSGILNAVINTLFKNNEVVKEKEFYMHRKRLQLDFLHGPNHANEKNSVRQMAFNTVLVLLNHPGVMPDCLQEYMRHMGEITMSTKASSMTERALTWLGWIQETIKAGLLLEDWNIEWAAKMIVAFISQLHILRYLRRESLPLDFIERQIQMFKPQQQKETIPHQLIQKLSEALLLVFSKVLSIIGSPVAIGLPRFVVEELQRAASELVASTPAVKWSSCLDALCHADPSYSFISEWENKQRKRNRGEQLSAEALHGNEAAKLDQVNVDFSRRDKTQTENEYEEALSRVLIFANNFPHKTFKDKAIRAAILAAPTALTLLKSIGILSANNLVSGSATDEEMEAFLSTEYGNTLINLFEWLTELETPQGMAMLLLKAFESNTDCMVGVLRIFTSNFVRHQITRGLVKDSKPLSWEYLKAVIACPHTLIIPLLHTESLLVHVLVERAPLDLAALAIVKLSKQVDAFPEDHECRGLIIDPLMTWIQQICARAANTVQKTRSPVAPAITPSTLYSLVISLFGEDLSPDGFLTNALAGLVPSLLQQHCAVGTIIQDAGVMCTFPSQVIISQYYSFTRDVFCKYLMEENESMALDARAEELLQWLCIQTNDGVLMNAWIQQDFCATLLDFLVKQGYHTSLTSEKLVDSKFLLKLLQIEVRSPTIKGHLLYVLASKAWADLQKQLEIASIKVELISKLLSYPEISWEKICEEQKIEAGGFKVASDTVTDYFDIQLKGFQMLLNYARLFEGHRFTGEVIQNCKLYMQDRTQGCKNFTLNKIKEPNHWPIMLTTQFLASLLVLEDSKILMNIFKEKESQAPTQHTSNTTMLLATSSSSIKPSLWTSVANLLEASVQSYEKEWKNLSQSDYSVERLKFLLRGVDQRGIEVEANLAAMYFNSNKDQSAPNIQFIFTALSSWINYFEKKSLVEPLLKIGNMLSMKKDEAMVLESLLGLHEFDTSGTLGEFLEIYNKNVMVIDYFPSKDIEVLKQLAESEELIRFLKENTDEDLRMLTDAIEEQAEDAVVDEVTVSDLIHIDKLLRPLMQSSNFTVESLKAAIAQETKELADAAQLRAKLHYCNANIHRIRHFVASLADRSSVLKTHMSKILELGVYTFTLKQQSSGTRGDTCKFLVLCDPKQKLSSSSSSTPGVAPSNGYSRQQFTLTDLKDLRSRARMLLSMRRIKQDVQLERTKSSAGQRLNMNQALNEFVEHVNLAERLIEQLCDAQKSGHILFDKIDWSISGLVQLRERVEWMDGQIASWHAALNKARQTYNCLNFFKGIELRLMYHCFIARASSDQLQICWELLEWAKPGLPRGEMKKCKQNWTSINMEMKFNQTNWEYTESQLRKCLNSLGFSIDMIFASAEPEASVNRLLKATSAQSSETPIQDPILLISVEDQQRELNLVVEIFHKHYGHLQKMANNLLLCSITTSWEDIHLIIHRFLASNHDSDVFVIAFIEKLTFECQTQLTGRLHHISVATLQKIRTNQLVLVCAKTQALQGVSHHLQVPIQFREGLEPKSMYQQLPAECRQMKVVTSELSGMGKSRYIKCQKHGLCVTLPISGDVSHEILIEMLKGKTTSGKHSLHLDITTEKDYENLNGLLFELLICGTLKSSHVGVYRLKTAYVYVELANTLGNLLEASLSICSWLPQQHVKWDLGAWNVSKGLESDDQVVCVYLDKLATYEINKQDIVFFGASKNVEALPEPRCRKLISKYFIKESSQMSYTLLAGFIKTLAYQLRKFGANDFCKCETLCWILGKEAETGSFRLIVVESLLQAARDHSLRSVKPWLHEEQKQISAQDINKSMHERMSSMLRWSDSNHVMIFFDARGLMRILYRDKKLIPHEIEKILTIQVKVSRSPLPDYAALSSDELWQILWPIVCASDPGFVPEYVLTPDNFLKMALISLRINTHVPVIIMGETGCGKTSLLKALATFSNAKFTCLTLHAGSTEEDIQSFIRNATVKASAEETQVWAFLDEINACPHLGLLNAVLCHHTLCGKSLHPNLVVLAACNPYRLQETKSVTSGLQMKNLDKRKKQELAYTVYPLPEAMLDHVWDYGILSDSDERAYIAAMIGERKADIIDLISHSQKFMRENFGFASVSLRDIQRWISLYDWFQEDISTRFGKKSELRGPRMVDRRAKVLACSLCYHCHFPGKDLRRKYREMCCPFISPKSANAISQAKFLKILHEEQRDIISRMEIPPGIAINSSLLENVFIVLVCLLNYIPVFVVGKPGSGKTLALHIIYSNLRGTDSKDEYFQRLPRILFLSYQGSQNSTSEGILKVFDKAKRYVHSNRARDILVVVVLDEVGLAETSHHNPLKVLHPLLEPDVREIAVVGISNWSLDAAKMNRGIHLSQSDPGVDDLYQTSVAIFESYESTSGLFLSDTLRRLAAAYHTYRAQQARADFHGLRDFYSLVKSLRHYSIMLSPDQLAHSLWRNFGGGSFEEIKSFFIKVGGVSDSEGLWNHSPFVLDLIKENLGDPEARHLMLITKGDSASNILQHMLQHDENFVVIRGSTYQDDKNEEYCYLMLSDIILFMEMGRYVLLENAGQIWTSLYDMLNQHYSYVGGRRNCRIALGAYSNPMCFVHDNFRCIVVVEENQIPDMDPPFLNRFEKQSLTYESILNEAQRTAVETIRAWAHKLANMGCNNANQEFPESQVFAGYYQDSVPSLVMLHSTQLERSPASHSQLDEEASVIHSQLVQRCKVDLIQTANVDAIARVHLLVEHAGSDPDMKEFKCWTEMFLSWQALQSLRDCIQANIANSEEWTDSIGTKLIITTCTPVQWSIQQDIEGIAETLHKVNFMRLGDFSSEKQLQAQILKFWSDDQASMLILQADDTLDKDHISLAKFHVDKSRKACQDTATPKHVVIIVHVQQGVARQSNFSFLCGWKQVTLHRLQKEPIAIRDYLDQSMREILQHEAMPVKHIMARVLTWSYLCIKFDDPTLTASYPQQMVQSICEDGALITCIKQRALERVLPRIESMWQSAVLNNQKLLSTSASVHDAFVQYIEERFREAVARIIYLVEKTSSLKSYFSYDAEKKHTWRQVFMLPDALNCDMAPAPCYPEGYAVARPLDLNLPFSSLYAGHLDKTFQSLYLETFSNTRCSDRPETFGNSIDRAPKANNIQKDVDTSLTPLLSMIRTCIHWDLDSYIQDFSKINATTLIEDKMVNFQALEWILRENLYFSIRHPSDLHILCWETESDLKAQVSLALLCIPPQEIKKEVDALKAGRAPTENFSEELAIRCSRSMLPTSSYLQKAGGTHAWLQKSQEFAKLLPLVGYSSLVFVLQSLQDLALFVILPLKKKGSDKILSELASWFLKKAQAAHLVTILRKIVDCVPNFDKLNDFERKCWIDFLCSVLKRYPVLTDLPKHDSIQIFSMLMTSTTPSCMMGHVMFQLLNSYLSTLRVPYRKRGPLFMILLTDGLEAPIKKDWAGGIVFSDQLYHDVRQTITAPLLGGEDTEIWDFSAFNECLCLALKFCEESELFTLRKVAAMALWKSFLYSAAYLLNQAKTNLKGDKQSYNLVLSPALVKALSNISSALKYTIQTFFMKVLHWDVGLSAGDIAELSTFPEDKKLLLDFSFFLDHYLVKNYRNRLGFNPYISSLRSFVSAEQKLKLLISSIDEQISRNSGQEEPEISISKTNHGDLRKLLSKASLQDQVMWVSAIASTLFVAKSGEQPSQAEWTALEWLRENTKNWDPLPQLTLTHLFKKEQGGIWHYDKDITNEALTLRCLILDILVKVATLPTGSPLRGYCMLTASHFQGAYVLTDAQSLLKGVGGLGDYREYVHSCGFIYIIGNCTRPSQVGTCPQCRKEIGGTNHQLLPGNVALTESGRTVGHSAVENIGFTIRIQQRSFRLLRILVHCCFLIGACIDRDVTQLAEFMQLANEKWTIINALKEIIEKDIHLLGKLIACQPTMTSKFIHSMLQPLSQITIQGPLRTVFERDQWEIAFEKMVEKQPIQETISEYLKMRGTDGLNHLLLEKSPCPIDSLQNYFRITKLPCLSDYETMFLQSKQKLVAHPCIAAVLSHRNQLDSLKYLMPIVKFSASLRQALGHMITRPAAATRSIKSITQDRSDLADLYKDFEQSWNKIRHEVEGFECRQFQEPVPEMHKERPIALCLLEKKDQGIYITAIFELLRTRQNDFLERVEAGLLNRDSAKLKPSDIIDNRSMPSVPVELCKAGQIVSFQESWLNDVVGGLGMCNQSYGAGTTIEYDDSQIEHQIFYKMIQGKPLLKGDYVEFPYQQESFQRHATLISDVQERVAQEALASEKLTNISRELTVGALGAGQVLANLELCLGFLRKTNANASEPLRDYCNRWLDKEAHPIFSKAVLDGVEIKHVVSLYEGLEEVASSAVEDLVTSRYRSKLDDRARADLKERVMVKKPGWGAAGGIINNEKLGAEAFRDALRRFMFRYLTADTFKPEEELIFYLTNSQLVTWPAWDVDQDTLDDIFPSSFKLKHARAIFIALKEMCEPLKPH